MYTAIVVVKRTVLEKYICELNPEDPADVADIVFEHFSTFPDSEYDLITRRKAEEETLDTTIVDLQCLAPLGNDNDGQIA